MDSAAAAESQRQADLATQTETAASTDYRALALLLTLLDGDPATCQIAQGLIARMDPTIGHGVRCNLPEGGEEPAVVAGRAR